MVSIFFIPGWKERGRGVRAVLSCKVCVFVNISRYGFVIIGYSHRWAVLHVFFVFLSKT